MSSLYEREVLRRDALQEVLNISMGQAADTLACLIDERVHLSIPRLHDVEASRLEAFGSSLIRKPCGMLTRQSFGGFFRGEVLACFERGSKPVLLAPGLGFPVAAVERNSSELILELTNLLASACLKGVAEQLACALRFGPPSVLATASTVTDFLGRQSLIWHKALFLEISFSVDSLSLVIDLLICVPEQESRALWQGVDRMLGQEDV